jgi:hypothetical protein
MGYAFINFIDSVYIFDFFKRFNDQKWEKFNSDKICQITYGRIQGKKALENNFANMSATERGIKVRPLIMDIQQPDIDQVHQMRKYLLKDLRFSKKPKKSLEWEECSSDGRYPKQ